MAVDPITRRFVSGCLTGLALSAAIWLGIAWLAWEASQ